MDLAQRLAGRQRLGSSAAASPAPAGRVFTLDDAVLERDRRHAVGQRADLRR